MVSPDENQEFIIERIYDPISLHTLASLGGTNIIPNLETGQLESIQYVEFAHMVCPILKCPNCNAMADEGAGSKHFTPSLIFKSASGQFSYLCEPCWAHSIIPPFGIFISKDDNCYL